MSVPLSRPDCLTGLTAVVTGASSGIGRAVAVAFAQHGALVVLHARSNRDGLSETTELVQSFGGATHLMLHDFESANACRLAVSEAWNWRPIDVWVHNAGADVLTGGAAELSFDDKLDLLYRTDVRGTMTVCREVGSRMKQRGRGTLLTIGWDQAEVGMAGDSGELFAATKGAVMSFTRSLSKSLAPEVRVNCLAPGWIQTKWGASAPAEWQARARAEALVQRWGQPEDVANAAVFLASPQSGFITGQVLNINGGFAGSRES